MGGGALTLELLRTELEALVREQMVRRHVPGVALGVVHGGEALALCLGVTNVEHPLPVTPETLFQVGSTTKTMTATVAVRRVEAGVLDLDAPIRRAMPEFRLADAAWADRVTARHLLTHTAGWAGDHFLMHPIGERGEGALAQVVARMPEVPLQTPPGETFAYSNGGFAVLGRLLEVLSGRPFEQLLATEVFAPLGMRGARFLPEDAIVERVVVGHRVADGEARVARPWALERAAAAHGGVISSLAGQLAYLRFHLGDGRGPTGERVLRAGSLAEMQREHVPAGSICDAFGLSWQLTDVGDVRTVRHGGETNGQLSEIVMVPPERFGCTVLTNATTGVSLNYDVVAWLLDRVLGARAATPATVPVAPERLGEYAARYDGVLKDVVVRAVEGALVLDVEPHTRPGRDPALPPPPVRLAFTGVDRVIALDEQSPPRRGEFLRDGAGAIRWLRWDGRLQGPPRDAAAAARAT